jgi:hypothetical protein
MAKLTHEQKSFIVKELAMYCSPAQVADRVKDEYGLVVTRQQVHEYNPLAVHKKPVAKEWREMFEKTRAEFLKKNENTAVVHRSYRLRQLDQWVRDAERRGNIPLAAQLLEQAAKEVGNAFTNRHELTGKGGKPLIPEPQPTIEQVDARIRALLKAPSKAADAPAAAD